MTVAMPSKMQSTETDIAVLQIQVKNIEDKVGGLKEDIKEVKDSLDSHAQAQATMFKELRDSSATAHKSLNDKVSALEKWRWMLMGAGIVIGSLGFDTIAKLLK